eukprot:TRINITY_DN116_c3_g1_i1.p1 TRINITY_DN116_c3_g1~~TRINITY_DN116_c3_g1_i1.p1  ORF type:complete len:1136 (+),score=366.80 TRINITY_DN116_c3_g1_i1:74-3481(+)
MDLKTLFCVFVWLLSFALAFDVDNDDSSSSGSGSGFESYYPPNNDACHVTHCGECTAKPECGFCATSYTCMAGDENGPLPGSLECPSYWVYNSTETIRDGQKVPVTMAGCIAGVSMPNKEVVPDTWEADFFCKNGGQRHWHDIAHNKDWGGSFCDCPDGWAGQDCGTCLRDNVCPHNETEIPACFHEVYAASEVEKEQKLYTCYCHGPTEVACNHLLGKYYPPSFRVMFDIRAGAQKIVTEHDGYALFTTFAAVENQLPRSILSGAIMAGNLTGCISNSKEACPEDDDYGWPDASQECMSYKCDHSAGHCPGGTKSHDKDPNSYRFYPGTTAIADFGEIYFYCNYNRWNNGTYYCAFNTDTVGPLTLMCQTGSCNIKGHKKPPPPPIPPPIPQYNWWSGQNLYVRYGELFMAPVGAIMAVCALIGYSHWSQTRRWVKRRKKAAKKGSVVRRRGRTKTKIKVDLSSKGTLTQPLLPEGEVNQAAIPVVEFCVGYELNSNKAFKDVRFKKPERAKKNSNAQEMKDFVDNQDGVFDETSKFVESNEMSRDGVLDSVPDRSKGVLLQNVWGRAKGECVAILGASGAGKSTLLDILSGRKGSYAGKTTGCIRIGGYVQSKADLKRKAAYLVQEDILMATQTVREALTFHAKLRLPGKSIRQIDNLVDDTIFELGLSNCSDSYIGDTHTRGISGGERRRVSIGIQLLTDPDVLLCDEPTSGLDAATAKAVVEALKTVAHGGRSVIMSIHQPRVELWSLFEKVVVLGGKGQLLFSGQAKEMMPFLISQGLVIDRNSFFNPADVVVDFAAHQSDQTLCHISDAFNTSFPQNPPSDPMPEHKHHDRKRGFLCFKKKKRTRVGFFKQFWLLLQRSTIDTFRNKNLFFMHIICALAVGSGIGVIYWKMNDEWPGVQDRMGMVFFTLTFFCLTNLSALGLWANDRQLFAHESGGGAYGSIPFYLAKSIVDVALLRILPPMIFSSFVYSMTGLNDTIQHALKWAYILILMCITFSFMCSALGAAFRSHGVANLLASLLVLFSLLFCGFLLNNDNVNSTVEVIQQFSILRYSFSALMVNEMIGQMFKLKPKGRYHSVSLHAKGKDVLDQIGIHAEDFTPDVHSLVMFAIGFFLISFIAFMIMARRAKAR